MTMFVALGMPGIMMSWGVAALRAIVDEALGDHCIHEIGTLEDLKQAWVDKTSANIILTSQFPDAALCNFLARFNAPYIVFCESGLDSAAYLARCTGQQDIGLVRSVSASMACLSQLSRHPSLVPIARERVGPLAVHRLVEQLCRHLRVTLPEGGMLRCLNRLGMGRTETVEISRIPTFEEAAAAIIAGYAVAGSSPDSLEPGARDVALAVLKPFGGIWLEKLPMAVAWPQESFLLADRAGESAVGAIDLVGRARCLLYGPYLHLAAGDWIARFNLGIDREIYRQIFAVEIHSGGLRGMVKARPSGTGTFAFELAFRIEDARQAVEIKLFTQTGAIEGAIAHWSVELVPAALSISSGAASRTANGVTNVNTDSDILV